MSEPRFTPGRCANCDSPDVTYQAPLYCSSLCRQMAEVVRHVRRRRNDGRWKRPDVWEAIQMEVAHILAGGYPERQRRVSQKRRAAVFQRADGKCEQCGRALDIDGSTWDPDAVATVQHVAGDSNQLSNLKAFCMRCNLGDAQSRFRPVKAGSAQAERLAELERRWSSPTPLRVCDDETRWPTIWWDANRQALDVLLGNDAYDDEDLPGFLGWTEQGTPIQDC